MTARSVGLMLGTLALSSRVQFLRVVFQMLPEQERKATVLAALEDE